jgi:ATP-dependent DNA helicase RecQ
VDKALFEALRALRREIAQENGTPAFAIFGDAALRDMARRKPTSTIEFLQVSGVGEKKCADYAARFLPVIQQYAGERKSGARTEKAAKPNRARGEAFALFKQGWGIAEVAEHLNRSSFQATMLLKEYIRENGITDPTAWIDPVTAEDIADAVEEIGKRPMEDLFERLNREVDVELISVVIACLENEGVV